jgi:hypothetical protein
MAHDTTRDRSGGQDPYVAPAITVIGDLTTLTQGAPGTGHDSQNSAPKPS